MTVRMWEFGAHEWVKGPSSTQFWKCCCHMSHVTCEGVMSHMTVTKVGKQTVLHVFQSHTHGWVMSLMNEYVMLWHTYGCALSRMRVCHDSGIPDLTLSYLWIYDGLEARLDSTVFQSYHIWMSHATHCNTLQHTTTLCDILQHTAIYLRLWDGLEARLDVMAFGGNVRLCLQLLLMRRVAWLLLSVLSHIRMSHVTYKWVMSHTNESCHIWMSYVTYTWVMSHTNESCHM